MFRISLFVVVAILLAMPARLAAESESQENPTCVKVKLQEGSCIHGVSNWKTLDLDTAFGEVQIPLKLVDQVQFKKHGRTVVATMHNGDRITGKLKSPPLTLDTVFGNISLPGKQIVTLEPKGIFIVGNHHNIRFENERVRESFKIQTSSDWKIKDKEFVGQSKSPQVTNFLTYKTYFRSIDRVLIRGHVLPPHHREFRVSVGPINMIFNWKCAKENHYRNDFKLTRTQGYALEPGKNHDIVFEQQDKDAVVSIDGREIYRTQAELKGTIVVYPAVGSTIAVSEIDIRGEADPNITVKGPTQKNTR